MLTTSIEVYLSAWIVGLLGGVHCLAMCGGIVSVMTLGLAPEVRANPWRMLPYQISYNLARLLGYALAGALSGGLGAMLLQLDALQQMQQGLYAIAGLVMILLGLYLGGWWRLLAVTERAGLLLWRHVEPLGRRLLPVRTPRQALLVGFIWAWIPCGLVYSVLILAVATAHPLDGALVLLAFGLGTFPNLMGIALLTGAAARIAERPWVRRAAGALVLGFGCLALGQLLL